MTIEAKRSSSGGAIALSDGLTLPAPVVPAGDFELVKAHGGAIVNGFSDLIVELWREARRHVGSAPRHAAAAQTARKRPSSADELVKRVGLRESQGDWLVRKIGARLPVPRAVCSAALAYGWTSCFGVVE
jgi:hypothetical protein